MAPVREVFLAVLEVTERGREDHHRLRDQAVRWFGSATVRCLDVEAREIPTASGPVRYQLSARFVRQRNQSQSRMETMGRWLGLVPDPDAAGRGSAG